MTDLRDRIEATVATAEAEGSKVISVEAIRGALDGEGVPQARVMAIPCCHARFASPRTWGCVSHAPTATRGW